MFIFGGFEKGIRQNSIIKYNFANNKWISVFHEGTITPIERAGHSAVVY